MTYEYDKEQHQFFEATNKIKIRIEAALVSLTKINREFSALFYLTGEVDKDAFGFLSGTLIRQNKFIETIYYAEKVDRKDKAKYEKNTQEQGYTGYKISPFPKEVFVSSIYPSVFFPIKFIEPYSVKNSTWFGLDFLTYSVVAKGLKSSSDVDADDIFYTPAIIEKNKIFAKRSLLNGYGVNSNDSSIRDTFGILLYKLDVEKIISKPLLKMFDSIEVKLDGEYAYRSGLPKRSNLFTVDLHSQQFVFLEDQKLEIKVTRTKNIVQLNLQTPLLVLLSGFLLTFFARYVLHSHIEYNKVLMEQKNIIEQEVKRKTEELTQQANELSVAYSHQVALTEELEAFSYSVSHDLRSPLRALDGFARAISDDYADKLDDEGKDFIDRICKASERMSALIDALLSLARITRKELSVEYFSITDIVNNIVATLREENPERVVTINVNASTEIKADKSLIYVVLDNLIRNAWKYTIREENPIIDIEMDSKIEKVTFSIKDNGVGFNMAYSKRLFGSFQRLHHQDDFEGHGIGLATAKRIIVRHGGEIWVEAEEGVGATFYFTIPQIKSDLVI